MVEALLALGVSAVKEVLIVDGRSFAAIEILILGTRDALTLQNNTLNVVFCDAMALR